MADSVVSRVDVSLATDAPFAGNPTSVTLSGRVPAVVALIGVLATLLLGYLVHDTMRMLQAAKVARAADAVADAAQRRVDGLSFAADAAATLLQATDSAAATPVLTRYVQMLLAQQPSLDGIAWVTEGAAPVGILRPGHPVSADWLEMAAAAARGPADGQLRVTALPDPAPADADTGSPRHVHLALVLRTRGADGRTIAVATLTDVSAMFLPEPGWNDSVAVTGLSVRDAVGRDILSREPDGAWVPPAATRTVHLPEPWTLSLWAVPSGPIGHILWAPGAVICFGLSLTVALAAFARLAERRYLARQTGVQALDDANIDLRRRLAENDYLIAALRESERRYRDIFENAVEGLFLASRSHRFLAANRSLVAMLGYPDEATALDALSDPAGPVFVDPADRATFLRDIGSTDQVSGCEVEVRTRDGRTLWVSLSARAVLDSAARPVGLQGSVVDVTARRYADTALRLAKEQADMANRAKTEFLANMSHELRTPLNAIIGFSEIIGEQALGPIDNPVYAEYARDIHLSGRMLLFIINDILDLSKIEAGRKELNERTVDVARTVRVAMRLVRERAAEGKVVLETDLAEPLPLVRADEVALKQILSNLLSNAIKFTPAGGRVTAGAVVEPDGRLLLTVRDTGIGIRPDDMPRALEPFRQIEGPLTRKAGGAGLGLPIVRALVDLHGGGFRLDSTPGVGTVAQVWLPADRLCPTVQNRVVALPA